MPHFFCAKCGQKIDADPSMAGVSLPCPTCKYQLTVPPLGTIANRLPPLAPYQQPAAAPAHQPAAAPNSAPWQAEPQPQPTPQLQRPSQRTRTRRAAGNPRQLIIGTAAGILAFVGIFAGLNAWEKSKATAKSKPNLPPAQVSSAPASSPSPAPATEETPAASPSFPIPAEKDWITTEHHGLRLRLPGKTVVPDAPIDPRLAERLVDGVKDSRRTTLGDTSIIITHSTSKPRYLKDARSLVSNNVSAFSELDSYNDVTMKRGETSISGRDAAYAQMSLTMLGKPHRHHIFYITHGFEVWEIFAIGPADTVSAVWDRICDSLEFPNAPTTSADGWVTNEFHGLHVDLPGKIAPTKSSGTDENGGWHNSQLDGPKYVIDLVHRTDPSGQDIHPPQMAQGLIQQTSEELSPTNLRSDQSETTVSGRKAIYTLLTYEAEGKPVVHHNLLIAEGAAYWSLSVMGRPGTTAGEWPRIRDSIKLITTSTPPAADDGWLTTPFHRLRLHLPGALVPTDFKPSPEAAKDLVGGTWHHAEVELEEYRFGIVHSVYKDGRALDPTRMLDGSLQGKSQDADVTDLLSKRGEFTVSGRKAVSLEMSYRREGIPEQHNALIIADGPETWFLSLLGEPELVSAGWKLITRNLELQEKPAAIARTEDSPTPKPGETKWVTTDLHGLRLPFPENATRSETPGDPKATGEQSKKPYGRLEAHVGQVMITVGHLLLEKPKDVRYSRDDMVYLLRKMALPEENFRFTDGEATISGRLAAFAETTVTRKNGDRLLNVLYVSQGLNAWNITISGPPDEVRPLWKRLRAGAEIPTAIQTKPTAPSPPPAAEKAAADGWTTNHFQGLQLDLPGTLTDSDAPTPSNIADGIVGGKWDVATLQSGTVRLHISHGTNKDGAALDLERMAGEVIRTNSRIGDVTDVRYKTTDTTISGFDAVVVDMSYTASIGKGQHHALTISNGPEAWYLYITGEAGEAAAAWERILPSVRFSTPPTPPAVPPSILKKPFPKGWAAKDFHGLSLHLPEGLTPAEHKTSPALAKQLEGKVDMQDVMLMDSLITITHRTYKPDFIPHYPKHRDSMIERILSAPDVGSPKVVRGETTFSGRNASGYEVTYVTDGEPLNNITGLLIHQGAECWELSILGPDKQAAAIYKQIRDSIQFKGQRPHPGAGDADWTTTDFQGLHLELPAKLKETYIADEEEASNMVGGKHWNGRITGKNYALGIAHGTSKNPLSIDQHIELESGANLSGVPGVTEIKGKSEKVTISGRKGVVNEASYLSDGEPQIQYGMVLLDGAKIWIITINGDPADVIPIWKRIRKTVTFGKATSAAPAPRRSSAPEGWVTNTINGLTLDLPTSPRISQLMQPPPEVAEMLVGGKWDHCRFARNGFEFNLVHSIYKADGEIDLRQVAEESAKGVSQIPGVTGLKTTIEETTVTGRKAIRGGLTYQHDGKSQLQNFLIISKGPEMWFLTTLGTPEKATAPAARIISGTRFERNPVETPLETASAADHAPAAPSSPATDSPAKPSAETQPAEWIATEFKGLRLRLPAVPRPEVSTAEDPHLVKGQSTFARVQHGSTSIGLHYMKYKEGSIPAYGEIADGAIKAIAGDDTVKNLTTRRRTAEVSGRPAYAVEMSYQVNGIPCQQNVLIILRDGENWLIDVTGRTGEVPAAWNLILKNTAFK